MHASLAIDGVVCSPEVMCQIMRQEQLVLCQPRPFRITAKADAEAAALMPDLVKRDCTADRPGVKFVGDITYIHTWQTSVSLVTVIADYSENFFIWSIADRTRLGLVSSATPRSVTGGPTKSNTVTSTHPW